jgi:hypothetical protein
LPVIEVDPTSAVVGSAGGVPLIDTFQEPVAAACVGALGGSAINQPTRFEYGDE